MEKKLMKKNWVTLKQENKEVQLDYALLQKFLTDFNLNDKDE